MNTKKFFKIVSVLFASALFLSSTAVFASPKITLKFNTFVKSADQKGQAGQTTFKRVVEELTDGKVEVKFYYNWALANNTEAVIGGLQMKSFEVSDWNVASFAEYSKAFLPLDAPYLVSSSKVALEILRGEVGKMMSDRFSKETGIRILMLGHNGFRHISNSKKPITKPADLVGMKIRTQSNPLHLMGFKALGASPTPMSFADLFTALQQGVVDGQENPIFITYVTKLYEVQKYYSLTSHLYSCGAFIMGEEYYQSLPADIREAIDKASVAAREAIIEEVVATDAFYLSEIAKKTEVNQLSDVQILEFQKEVKKVWPEMAKIIGEDYFNAIREGIEKIENEM